MVQMFSASFDVTPRAPMPTREQLHALEDAIRASGAAIDYEERTHHHFAHGVYGREVRIRAGDVVVGKPHRHSTLNILASGELSVTTPEGVRRVKAPAIFTSPAGCKKVAYAHTDAVFINVHPSSETDLAKLEAEFIAPEPRRELGQTPQLEESSR